MESRKSKFVVKPSPLDAGVMSSLGYNGTFFPDVERIVFNLKAEKTVPALDKDGKIKRIQVKNPDGSPKTDRRGNPVYRNAVDKAKLDRPVLATKVEFEDGSSVTVKNSIQDPVEIEETEVEKGSGVKVLTASRASKERGVVYAIIKRLLGEVDENGAASGRGFSGFMREIVDEAYDQNLAEAKAKRDKAVRRAKYEDEKKRAEENRKNARSARKYTHADLVNALGPIAEILAKKISENPGVVDDILGVKPKEGQAESKDESKPPRTVRIATPEELEELDKKNKPPRAVRIATPSEVENLHGKGKPLRVRIAKPSEIKGGGKAKKKGA